MSHEYEKGQKVIAAIVVGTIIMVVLWTVAAMLAPSAREHAEQELAGRTGFDHWWHKDDPETAAGSMYALALIGTPFGFWLAYVTAPVSLRIVESAGEARLAAKAKIERRELEESVRAMDAESQRQTRQMGVAQSRQEIITRLGTVDQFIRVYRAENDRSRQVVSLQAAQAEINSLNGKLVSGEIDAESLAHSEIVQCVRETIADLHNAGLRDDRICRDLRRIFQLKEAA